MAEWSKAQERNVEEEWRGGVWGKIRRGYSVRDGKEVRRAGF